ncbi:ChrR family anti-sigma-E factor [Pseudidiomarina terrestris]|uniref:Cupin domain-containing protein n=1 Tax=Pseudidiomarina terrestris TaxID=2820060 RepID=A0AAW7QVA6_9GAMM|nr:MULTISPECIES: ChrR family anti-sigma-E factor [unclassified Pseudidiomarina]MDN7124190.1 cupin domain-containing protein [Pseudidiomarina sp. 1APP75-32.1]MDN7127257.1 cupin domain-containing protein [Pseudidiomarina sp. 1APR75-33.1]MDN7128447.1 cupin domain-containing protein [Pseudidiomarina sp. 1APR75-15]MDN7135305.1 cupin domain-containing protein [Pseudidiomarina sp. 1ASP75-5]MDN7138636.1 cupin domain-containing protein [Pseudidiomarina sp. 1ASP75-14]
MIKFHPSEEHLFHYVTGDLTPAMLMMVGTHVDMCSQCQRNVQHIEETMAQKLFGQRQLPEEFAAANDSFDGDEMLAQILAQPQQQPRDLSQQFASELVLEGKRFQLPGTLARNHHRIGQWHKLLGQMWRAPVQVGGKDVLTFIYMAENTRVPEHTHKGNEATLVVNGVFNDETSDYRDGDFVFLDGSVKHTPETRHEDCLTLSALDAPMHFTSGVSRLLNPFSSLFFK